MTQDLADKLSKLKLFLYGVGKGLEEDAEIVLQNPDVRRIIRSAETSGAAAFGSALVGLCPIFLRPVVQPLVTVVLDQLEDQVDQHLTEWANDARDKAAGAGDPNAPLVTMSAEAGAAAVAKALTTPAEAK